jgi:hypothetical protein
MTSIIAADRRSDDRYHANFTPLGGTMASMKLAAMCGALLLACGGNGDDAGTGFFRLTWDIQLDGQPATCADVGGSEVELIVDNDAESVTDTFACDALEGTSRELAAGDYIVTATLLDAAGADLSLPSTDGATIISGETDLGQFPFVFGDVCDASSCPTGCCTATGVCIDPQTDLACGRGGEACEDCLALGQVCNAAEGTCIE